ncbi:MAG: type II toxin-antitoxin system RelE/ParE family toxin [Rhizobiaceae bacterium]|nr:type II toxin-antitoxin system RelE/ParE family toxin [Rhizobiaceae bacterium]
MARRFIFAADARHDLATITDFLISANPRAAEAFVARTEKAVRTLGDHPHLGPLAPETGRPAIRRLSIPPYIIYYRAQGDVIQVVRLLHSSREIDEKLFVGEL